MTYYRREDEPGTPNYGNYEEWGTTPFWVNTQPSPAERERQARIYARRCAEAIGEIDRVGYLYCNACAAKSRTYRTAAGVVHAERCLPYGHDGSRANVTPDDGDTYGGQACDDCGRLFPFTANNKETDNG